MQNKYTYGSRYAIQLDISRKLKSSIGEGVSLKGDGKIVN